MGDSRHRLSCKRLCVSLRDALEIKYLEPAEGQSILDLKLLSLWFLCFFPPLQCERSELHKTKHIISSLEWVWLVSMFELLIMSDVFSLQTGSTILHTPEGWHPQHQPAGQKRCITQSMQLHLTDAIRDADTEHCRSALICHNPTQWICCQHNMYVVPVQPNQQRSSGDKVCNIQQQREGEKPASVQEPEAMPWLLLRDLLI